MFNWLIHFLGGFTREEYDLINLEFTSQHELAAIYRAREESILKDIEEHKNETKFLQNILFKRFGVIDSPVTDNQTQEEFKPLVNGPSRWSSLKAKLEKDDMARANFKGV